MRILVVEDDPALRDALHQALSQAGYGVDPVSDGNTAVTALKVGKYDLVLLDLGLPYIDGIDILRLLRSQQNHTPVLVLSARDGIDQRVLGLRSGADDYLIKPFALPELEARIDALIRRASGGAIRLKNGPLELDLDNHIALLKNKPLEISVREFTILEALMRRVGQVVIKSRLTEQISAWEREVGTNAIEVYVHRLRKKLEPSGIRIRTIHGLGYLLEIHNEI